MGLFDFLGVCRFRGGHGLFHTGVVRQPDGGKRGPNIEPVISTLGAFFLSVIALLAGSSFTLGSQSSQACLCRLPTRLRSEFHLSARV